MIFPQSFSHLSQCAYNCYVVSKMCSKWHPWRWRHTCIRRAKLSMTRTHSSYGISLIFAVIAAFSSPIVWGLFSYTLSLRYPHVVSNVGLMANVANEKRINNWTYHHCTEETYKMNRQCTNWKCWGQLQQASLGMSFVYLMSQCFELELLLLICKKSRIEIKLLLIKFVTIISDNIILNYTCIIHYNFILKWQLLKYCQTVEQN